MERIVIEIEPETKIKLKTLAFNENKTMKEILREAIEKVLRRLK